MIKILQYSLLLVPIMFLYLVESFVLSLPISLIWNLVLDDLINVNISYIQFVGIIWILKVVLFDVTKIGSGFLMGNNNQKEKE